MPTTIYQHLHDFIKSDIHDTDDKRSSLWLDYMRSMASVF